MLQSARPGRAEGDPATRRVERISAAAVATMIDAIAAVRPELRGYLECGMLCFGFGRAVCTGCGTGFVVAFSCKGRGICPSCNGRHMAQTRPSPTSSITSTRRCPCGRRHE